MKSQTKIVIIPFKKLLIGAIIVAILVAFIIFAVAGIYISPSHLLDFVSGDV